MADIVLYGFAHAGAGASVFLPMMTGAPTWMDVAGIQLPGRECRWHEACVTSLEETARTACDAIIADQPRAVALFGHSLGGRLAVRCAQMLQTEGCEPLHLFVSASSPTYPAASICHLDDDAFTRAIVTRFKNVPPEIISVSRVWDLYRPIVRADLEMLETADDFQGEITCPLTIIVGEHDTDVPAAMVLDWMRFATGPRTLKNLDVDHNALRSAGHTYLDLIVATLFDGLAPRHVS